MAWVPKSDIERMASQIDLLSRNVEFLLDAVAVYEHAKAENVAAAQVLSNDVALLREAIEGFDPATALENAFEKIKFSMRRVK